MKRMWWAAGLLLACSSEPTLDAGLDAPPLDVEAVRDTPRDDAEPDAGGPDADEPDAGEPDAGGPDAGEPSGITCWPWEAPSLTALRTSPRRVYAHYFSPFPISIDNLPPDADYYENEYLAPDGEGGIHASYGGYLRERPLGRAPYPAGADWVRADVETEIERAMHIGLSGFSFDILDLSDATPHRARLEGMLAAARDTAPEFRILLVPDMTSAFPGDDESALATLEQLMIDFGDHPSLERAADGRVVLAPFAPERRSGAFWGEALRRLEAIGHPVALMPMPVGGFSAEPYVGLELFGGTSWGGRTVASADYQRTEAASVHAAGLLYMAPVAPQDARPRPLIFTESNNSAAYRAQWTAAIESGAEWAQVITWNDYGESTEVAPSSRTETAFYDLTAYYTAWFLTGAPPPIVRDGLYYFHRAHAMDPSVTPPGPEQARAMAPQAGAPISDEVELLAFLASPGTLEIELGGRTTTLDAPGGITSFTVPLVPGTPVFRLRRGTEVIVELRSETPIVDSIVYQDPLYHAGASLSCPVP